MAMAESPMRYRAFFSYARSDERIARALHRYLDTYRTPKQLKGNASGEGVRASLHPIFRDRTDLPSGAIIGDRLEKALSDSETLVVLCSPAASTSQWVNREVETFLKLRGAAHVFPVVAPGLPDCDDLEAAYYPPALRGLGLLAADMRSIRSRTGQIIGDGVARGRLKLVAGLLGAQPDELARRDRARQNLRRSTAFAAGVLFLALVGAVTALTMQGARSEDRNRELVASEDAAREAAALAADNERIARARVLADRAWSAMEQGNYPLAVRYALAGYQIAPENADLYRAALARALHVEGSIALQHGHYVRDVAFSPDGKTLVTAANDGVTRLWSSGDGALLHSYSGLRDALSAGFLQDGRSLFVAGGGGPAAILNVETGAVEAQLSALPGDLSWMRVSPDRSRIVIQSAGRFALYDGSNGREIASMPNLGSEQDTPPISADASVMLAFESYGKPVVLSTSTGKVLSSLRGGVVSIWSAQFSADGTVLATASPDGPGQIWNVRTGEAVAEIPDASHYISISPDGRLVAAAGESRGSAAIWSARSGKLVHALSGHSENVRGTVFSADGRLLATWSWDDTIRIWDSSTGDAVAVLSSHNDTITRVVFSPDGRRLASASHDGTARIWDIVDRRTFRRMAGVDNVIESLAFSPDGRRLAGGDSNKRGLVWDTASGARTAMLEGHTFGDGGSAIRSIAYSGDGRRIVTGGRDNTARIWDAESGALLHTLTGHTEGVEAAIFTREGTAVVTGSIDHSIRLWNSATGEQQGLLGHHDSEVFDLAVSPDGKRLGSTASNDGLQLWDLQSLKPLGSRIFVFGDRLDWSADGRRIAVAGDGIPIVNPDDGTLANQLGRDSELIRDVAFSPTGNVVAAATDRNGVRLWDVATGRELAFFEGMDRDVSTSAFSPDGRWLADAIGDDFVRVWNISRLTAPVSDLVAEACGSYLPEETESRVFSAEEMAADAVLAASWSNDEKTKDVCGRAR